jgi:hypothetical protein
MLHTKVVRIDPVPQHSIADGNQARPKSCAGSGHCQPLRQQAGLQWRVLTESQHNAQTSATAAPLQGEAMALEQQQQQQQEEEEGAQQEWLFDALASCVGIFSENSLPQVGRCPPIQQRLLTQLLPVLRTAHTRHCQEAVLLLQPTVWVRAIPRCVSHLPSRHVLRNS